MSEERSALARWSERKLAARRGDAPAETDEAVAKNAPALESRPSVFDRQVPTSQDPTAPNHAAQEPVVEAGRTAAEEPDAAGKAAADDEVPALPPVEELNAQSDYTVFLAKGVPEELTRAALRKLWTSDPVLANRDGLNIYDEDYNLIDKTITAVQTSYRPGIGYPEELEEKLAQLDDSISGSDRESARSAADSVQRDREAKSETAQPDDLTGQPPGHAPEREVAPESDAAIKRPDETEA